jgi:hypothetical protein
MYKVFKLNKNDKIEFTKDELKSLLDEVYREGEKNNNDKYYYWSPSYTWPSWVYCNTGSLFVNDNDSHKISITPDSAIATATSIPASSITTSSTSIPASSTSRDTTTTNYKDLMTENKTTVHYGDN